MPKTSSLDGFDPLAATDSDIGELFDQASRREINNILKSYTGYYDVFSEMLQNALDAIQQRHQLGVDGYEPKLWITIDIPNGKVRVVDNGVGMDENEFKFCLRPNRSFKNQTDFRGHKGVGATFLAYGFSFAKLQSKQPTSKFAAILRLGRSWAEDSSGSIPRPKFEEIDFDVPELAKEPSGTAIEIAIGQSSGERPKHLAWMGATNAEQWLSVLRIKTPLGGVYLSTPIFLPTVELNVISPEGTETKVKTTNPEYFYPHEIPNLKTQSLRDIQNGLKAISGDSSTQFTKLDSK